LNAPPRSPRPSAHALLREHGLQAKKGFGQNFLTDGHTAARIAEAATPAAKNGQRCGTVLEIGPGLGALTVPLLERAERVIAIDRDPQMVNVLRQELSEELTSGALTLHCEDAIAADWAALLSTGPAPHAVVGNLPYLVTGRFLERAVELSAALPIVVFMVQKEVADRLLSAPGTKEYGALTVFVRAAFKPSRLCNVKSGSFFPKPNVDSAVVVLERSQDPTPETPMFRALVKMAFAQRRKTLRNAWQGGPFSDAALEFASNAAGIDRTRRGETLSLEEFRRMELELRQWDAAARAAHEAPEEPPAQ
jgi:16S rRNA (adenine1518-N6/adenine1519-N6)-dimethyltransferase